MKSVFHLAILLLIGACARGQESHVGKTLLVIPFENHSKAPGLDWIGEAFPEVLGHELASGTRFVISRDDRLYALDRLGIPSWVKLSRASAYDVARQIDADYVVMGTYDFDGKTFKASAELLDMSRLHLAPAQSESGALPDLIDIERSLAWDLMRIIEPDLAVSRKQFLSGLPPIRLDAFENYVRGTVASNRDEAIQRLRKAVQLEPSYTLALLQLGKTYYAIHDYSSAGASLRKVAKDNASAPEANYYLGLASYYAGDFASAENAFEFVASRMPLTEVYNNIGVVQSRRGKKPAGEDYFRKAVQDDPQDADYRFNLAISMCRNGDRAGCATQLKEVLARRAGDREAKNFLDNVTTKSGDTVKSFPLERIKSNYDENSFRQLALEINNWHEEKLAGADPARHAEFHREHGREMLAEGFVLESAKELRESLRLNPADAATHLLLARALEGADDEAHARLEAESALHLHPGAEGYVFLGEIEMKQNRAQQAEEDARKALELDPRNAAALNLLQGASARLIENAHSPVP